MANNNHTYRVDLDLQQTSRSKAVLKELQQSNQSIEELNSTFNKLQQNGIEAGNEYRKILHKEVEEYDKKLAQLEEERVHLLANKKLSKEELDKELKSIATQKKSITAHQKELQVRIKLQKLTGKTYDEESKMLKIGNRMLSIQEKLNKLLGKESKLRQGISKVAGVGVKVAKGIGIAGAAAGAVVGGVVSSAQGIADKERAMQSLKSGIDPSLADEVFIKTGADYGTIVNALNTLVDVTKDRNKLIQGAALEVQNPGFGKVLLSSARVSGENINILNTALRQVQSQTGLQDISGALEASTNARSVTHGRVSQVEYLQAYGQLKGAGFDDEKIDRIIRNIASRGDNFIEQWNKTDLSRFTYDRQLKNRLKHMDLSLSAIDPNQSVAKTSAESMAEKMRMVQLKKDELMVKLLPVVEKIVDAIDPQTVDKIADGLVDFLKVVLPALKPVITVANKVFGLIGEVMDWFKENFIDHEQKGARTVQTVADALKQLPAKANGGLVTTPSLCGEAGPELVLPLTKPQRCEQLMTQYLTTNNFNINGNPNALGLSQQINNHKFIRNASMW